MGFLCVSVCVFKSRCRPKNLMSFVFFCESWPASVSALAKSPALHYFVLIGTDGGMNIYWRSGCAVTNGYEIRNERYVIF